MPRLEFQISYGLSIGVPLLYFSSQCLFFHIFQQPQVKAYFKALHALLLYVLKDPQDFEANNPSLLIMLHKRGTNESLTTGFFMNESRSITNILRSNARQ